MAKINRWAVGIDDNQKEIVKQLRKIPGVSVELDHDDALVGYKGKTFWYEIKNPKTAFSKKTGELLQSALKDDQKRILDTFTGHYLIVSTLEEILCDLGIKA